MQLLSESMLLALFGTLLGALIAQGLSRALVAFLTTKNNAIFVGLELDFRVLGFMAAVAILTCLLFGLVPAIRATQDLAGIGMQLRWPWSHGWA